MHNWVTATPEMRRNGLASAAAASAALFLRQWIAHPRRMGGMMPSSPALARLIARLVVVGGDGAVLELGPGTGALTAALLEAGLAEERLILVEIDDRLHDHLRHRFPGVEVLHGDAASLTDLIPAGRRQQISTVVSSLPMLCIPAAVQRVIVDQCFAATGPKGRLIQYTYSLSRRSPLDQRRLGLRGRRVGWILGNLPPVTVWRYRRATDFTPPTARDGARGPGRDRPRSRAG